MMLQRTRAAQVVPVWTAFTGRWPSLDAAKRSDAAEMQRLLEPLGLRWRIRNLVGALRMLERLDSPSDLRGIPGVGHYIQSAVSCFAFGERVALVDANVVRFYAAAFGFEATDQTRRDRAFHDFAREMLPDARFKEYNWAIIDIVSAGQFGEVLGPLSPPISSHA
jgi:A/G-specific adenine glycosylase